LIIRYIESTNSNTTEKITYAPLLEETRMVRY